MTFCILIFMWNFSSFQTIQSFFTCIFSFLCYLFCFFSFQHGCVHTLKNLKYFFLKLSWHPLLLHHLKFLRALKNVAGYDRQWSECRALVSCFRGCFMGQVCHVLMEFSFSNTAQTLLLMKNLWSICMYTWCSVVWVWYIGWPYHSTV